jgi:hypothetical protein
MCQCLRRQPLQLDKYRGESYSHCTRLKTNRVYIKFDNRYNAYSAFSFNVKRIHIVHFPLTLNVSYRSFSFNVKRIHIVHLNAPATILTLFKADLKTESNKFGRYWDGRLTAKELTEVIYAWVYLLLILNKYHIYQYWRLVKVILVF